MLACLRLWLSAAVVLCASCASTQSSRSADSASDPAPDRSAFTDATPIDASGARLAVFGMSCPKCVSNVDLTLKRLPGVATVAINMRDGIVDVGFTDGAGPSPRELARAVDDAGLTLTRIEAIR